MSTAVAPASTQAVHQTIPGFTALYEGAVNWSACGPVANEVAVAVLEHRKPDVGLAKEAVTRDTAAGRFGKGGQRLADIAWDLGQRGYVHLDVVPFSGSPDLTALHNAVRAGALAGFPVITQV